MVPDLARVARLARVLLHVESDAAVRALDLSHDPGPAVDRGAAELVADLGHFAVMHAAPELLALAVLTDPDDVAFDAGLGPRRAAAGPDELRVVGRLLGSCDLSQRQPELLDRRIAPVPEAAPDPANDAIRVEGEREREEGAVELGRQLEEGELGR